MRHLMVERLRIERSQHRFSQRGLIAYISANVKFIGPAQARLQAAIRRQPQPIARFAEMSAYRMNEAE